MNQKIRTLTYLIVLATVVLLAYCFAPAAPKAPSGILLPISENHYAAVDPSQVTISQNGSGGGAVIGTINVQMYNADSANATEAACLSYIKNLAAQAGANNVTINAAFENPDENTFIFQATAFRN
jgi:hypothetical protein